jgi:Rrf2 family transcriptional regulator, cysteine metabolism repressor
MKISRTIAYAIQATLDLARRAPGIPVPSSELAREGGMPERFLLHVLRCLVTHGVLCSTRGVDGGYYLSREASSITLRDIVDAFDNANDGTLSPLTQSTSRTDACLLTTLQNAARAARDELQKVTIADLLRGEIADIATERLRNSPAAAKRL